MDFAPGSFPRGRVAQTRLARISVVVIRHDRDDLPAYLLLGDRSCDDFLWSYVEDAGRKFLA